jgi:hypothetical protein
MDAVGRQEFEPRMNMLPDTDWEIMHDEVVIVRPSSLTGEPEVF